MTAREKVAQLLALARSTPFAREGETSARLARTLFNKHRIADARLRWELLTALGLEAGPEPTRPQASSPRGTSDDQDWAWWREWMATEQAEQERWTRDGMKRAQRHQRATPTEPRTRTSKGKGQGRKRHRRGRSGLAARQHKRVRVRGHASARTVWGVPSYTREIATRPIRFTCAWCQTTVTQQRFPGPVPAYCSADCKADAQREQTRQRVRRYRARQR